MYKYRLHPTVPLWSTVEHDGSCPMAPSQAAHLKSVGLFNKNASSDLIAQVGVSPQQSIGLFWMQTSSLDVGLAGFILQSSLCILNTRAERAQLSRAQSVHVVVELPTGHQDRHLCDTGGLSFLWFAISYSIFQNQRLVGLEDGLPVLSAEQLADLLLEHDSSLCRHFTSQTLHRSADNCSRAA